MVKLETWNSKAFVLEMSSKVEKNYMGVFSTHFVPLILILASKIMEDWNNQLYNLWFLQATEAPHQSNSQNSIISFGFVDFWAKIFPIWYPLPQKSTTRITITQSNNSNRVTPRPCLTSPVARSERRPKGATSAHSLTQKRRPVAHRESCEAIG